MRPTKKYIADLRRLERESGIPHLMIKDLISVFRGVGFTGKVNMGKLSDNFFNSLNRLRYTYYDSNPNREHFFNFDCPIVALESKQGILWARLGSGGIDLLKILYPSFENL